MSLTRRHAIEIALAAAAAGLVAPPAWSSETPLSPEMTGTGTPDLGTPDLATPGLDALVNGASDAFDRLTVPVTLNGHGPYPFMVDTGANISCVARRVAQALALPVQPSRPVHTMVAVRSQPLALIDVLTVGRQTRRSMAALALQLEDPRLGGVLAVDWLQNQRLTLDFTRNSLELADSRHDFSRPGRVILQARRRLGQLTIVDAELGETRISALIDSGSEASLCNAPLRRLIERRRAAGERRQMVQMISVLGEPFAGELLYLPFLRLGGLELGNVPVVHADTHAFQIWGVADVPAVLLGMDLLRQFRAVSLDYGRSQVRFDLHPA
jgi:predicted aspartyl protease